MIERDIQKAILDWLNLVVGIKAYRRNTGAAVSTYKGKKRLIRYNQAGMSDIWAIGPRGIHIEIETKRPGKVLTDKQHDWFVDVIQAGGIAIWADSLKMACEALRLNFLLHGLPWDSRWDV